MFLAYPKFLTCKTVWPRVWESWMLSSVPHRVPIFKRVLVQMCQSWERIISLFYHHKQQIGIIFSKFLKGSSPEPLVCCCHTLPSVLNVALLFVDILFRSSKHIVFKPVAVSGLRSICYSSQSRETIFTVWSCIPSSGLLSGGFCKAITPTVSIKSRQSTPFKVHSASLPLGLSFLFNHVNIVAVSRWWHLHLMSDGC